MIREELPEFQGNINGIEFQQYVMENLNFKNASNVDQETVKLRATFTVDKSGKVTNPVINKDSSNSLAKELCRVLSESPKWTPGKKDGKPIDIKLSLPFNINAESLKSVCN